MYYDSYNSTGCEQAERVLASFPVAKQLLPASLLAASPASRGAFVMKHAFSTWGIAAEEGEGVLLLHSLPAPQITSESLGSAASVRVPQNSAAVACADSFARGPDAAASRRLCCPLSSHTVKIPLASHSIPSRSSWPRAFTVCPPPRPKQPA